MHTWIPYIAPFILLAVVLALFLGFGRLTGDSKSRTLFSYERRKLIDEALVLIAQANEANTGEAVGFLEQALVRAQKAESHFLTAQIKVGIADLKMLQKRGDEAIRLYEQVIATSPSWQGENPEFVLYVERKLLDARARKAADKP